MANENADDGWASFAAETARLRDDMAAGKLKSRLTPAGDENSAASRAAINATLDLIIQTYEKAVSSVENMSVGRIPEPFQDGFPDEFSRARDVCNHFIDVINRRNGQILRLTEGAKRGNLRVRTDVEQFTGVNRRIFEASTD